MSSASGSSALCSGSSAAVRLQKELMELMLGGAKGITAFPRNDDIFNWIAVVQGVEDTPYEGLEFQLSLVFSPRYPFEAPVVTFLTPCFHPNVDTHGAICLDILKEKWSAVCSPSVILLSIQNLLNNPNNQSPLNNQAASLWHKRDEFRRVVLMTYEAGCPKT